jgi:hypothetical protein
MAKALRPEDRGYGVTNTVILRLRELVVDVERATDDALRERLTAALRAVPSSDAITVPDPQRAGQQTFVPFAEFGRRRYAVVKDGDVVVTVLPEEKAEWILQRDAATGSESGTPPRPPPTTRAGRTAARSERSSAGTETRGRSAGPADPSRLSALAVSVELSASPGPLLQDGPSPMRLGSPQSANDDALRGSGCETSSPAYRVTRRSRRSGTSSSTTTPSRASPSAT